MGSLSRAALCGLWPGALAELSNGYLGRLSLLVLEDFSLPQTLEFPPPSPAFFGSGPTQLLDKTGHPAGAHILRTPRHCENGGRYAGMRGAWRARGSMRRRIGAVTHHTSLPAGPARPDFGHQPACQEVSFLWEALRVGARIAWACGGRLWVFAAQPAPQRRALPAAPVYGAVALCANLGRWVISAPGACPTPVAHAAPLPMRPAA